MNKIIQPARGVYRHADLKRLIDPRSIAIVGASPTATSFGAATLRNLGQFDGKLYPINPRYDTIAEMRSYPTIAALPEVPDCVVIAVPREGVEKIVLECAEAGVGGAIIYASGFAETGRPDLVALQEKILGIALEGGVRLVGPNCIGINNYLRRATITFFGNPTPEKLDAATVGLVSQSGALGNSLGQAMSCGVSFSHCMSSGNSCDIDVADYISYLAEDPGCKVIACVFEGVKNPARLIEAAEIAWKADKPLVIYKTATGATGAAAALSHTGSLAGSDAAYRAAFDRTGVVVVDDFEAVIETARFFAKSPRPSTRGVAVIASSGGAAVIAGDKADSYGVSLPQPSERVQRLLTSLLPEFGSAHNPCDLTAQAMSSPQSWPGSMDTMLSDDVYGALVIGHVYADATLDDRTRALSASAIKYGKAACVAFIGQWFEGPGARGVETDPRVALFRSNRRCFAAIAAWHKREDLRVVRKETARRLVSSEATDAARVLLEQGKDAVLTERISKQVLALYGIPVVSEQLAASVEEAVSAAGRMGYPVVAKLESPDLPHKTEADVIRLNLKNEREVREAYDAILANAGKVKPTPRIAGVLVQPMIPAGVEVIVGARIDALFGPLVVVGLGGILVELLKDTAVALAPVSRNEALAMLHGLKGVALLKGFRGSRPVDMDRLAALICRLSEFAADHRDRIAEVDVNPLICAADRVVAVDAMIARKVPAPAAAAPAS